MVRLRSQFAIHGSRCPLRYCRCTCKDCGNGLVRVFRDRDHLVDRVHFEATEPTGCSGCSPRFCGSDRAPPLTCFERKCDVQSKMSIRLADRSAAVDFGYGCRRHSGMADARVSIGGRRRPTRQRTGDARSREPRFQSVGSLGSERSASHSALGSRAVAEGAPWFGRSPWRSLARVSAQHPSPLRLVADTPRPETRSAACGCSTWCSHPRNHGQQPENLWGTRHATLRERHPH